MDNACYRKEVVEWFEQKQWDFSISVILVSRSGLPLKELVRRHREKQGQENAQKVH